jgi:hypothetical protein
MFESDGKRQLRSKYNKMQSISKSQIRKHKFQAAGQGDNSVYGELKLSEQLAS